MPDIEVVYFTDPFCSWCWATEPALLALRERHRGRLSVRDVMGGLVRDMSDFHDVANGFPTMLFRLALANHAEGGILVGGHRSLEVYERVVDELAPGPERQLPRSIAELLSDYGPLTTRELAVITGDREVRTTLASELSAGRVTRAEVRGGEFWARPNASA